MNKLKLQVQITADGFIAGSNGEMDWITFDWNDELKEYVAALTTSVDCIVLGRKLAQGFIPHWAAHPELEGADVFNNTRKIVFTKTLHENEWNHTVELATGDLVEEITKLKNAADGDIIAYGGATFVSNLIRYNLIDEYHLFINPVAIGSGMSIFKEVKGNKTLSLVKATPFECGIVALHYEPGH